MSWKLREISGWSALDAELAKGKLATIGCFWKSSNKVYVVLPPGGYDGVFTSQNEPGWTVVGEWPNVTLTPSINLVGIYHGYSDQPLSRLIRSASRRPVYIKDGEITDDSEGRTCS